MKTLRKMGSRPESKVANFLEAQISVCEHSQKEIAFMLGYDKPNIITMFKQGLTKLPIEKVGLMADALGINRIRLLKMVLQEYSPGVWEIVEDTMGYAVTENEMEIITLLRKVTNDSDPRLSNAQERKELTKIFKNLIT